MNDEKCDLFQGEAKFLTGGIVREPASGRKRRGG